MAHFGFDVGRDGAGALVGRCLDEPRLPWQPWSEFIDHRSDQPPARHAEIYRAAAISGESATVDAVLTSLSTAGVAHLAAHGRLSTENPLFSEIDLADGPLIAYDLEQLTRVPHTVVLAACETCRAVVHTGDELIGLSATFLARGATQLVASVVPVPTLKRRR